MKKVMTLAVIALLAFSLAGCGGADKKSSTAPSSPPPVKQESAADLFCQGEEPARHYLRLHHESEGRPHDDRQSLAVRQENENRGDSGKSKDRHLHRQ